MKKVLIFGSTGSIGRNTLDLISKARKDFEVLGLCVNSNIETLYKQIKEFSPRYVCVRDENQAKKIKPQLKNNVALFTGQKGLDEFSHLNSDISVMAISGISCLGPLLVNIEHTRRVALANKESIVTAGSLVLDKARRYGTEILPLDSEINALFQLIEARARKKNLPSNSLRKVYLTASGGALAGYGQKKLSKVSIKEALAHPNWKMGKRITIDSATLVNKGFEVIETHYFFGLPYKKINVVLHRESIIHALVEYEDCALLACLYPPDMKVPISFALYYPGRFSSNERANFLGIGSSFNNKKREIACTFVPFCDKDYPLFRIILRAAEKNDNALVILNACDEVAIDYFLKKKINFVAIHKVMDYIFKHYPSSAIGGIEDIFWWDNWAREKTKEYLDRL